jgi:hypothetical protein
MANVKVYNPKPRLINVAQPGGRFIRIAPMETAEVDEKSVASLLKSGDLVKGDGGKEAEEAREGKESGKSKG